MSIIRVDDLTFRYNGLDVISNITFAVEKGIYLGIVGPNGSGKSTLIKNILGILQPEQGRVELFGNPLSVFRQWRKIGYLPQRLSALNAHFPGTVEEIVQMGLPKKDAVTLRRTLEMMAIAPSGFTFDRRTVLWRTAAGHAGAGADETAGVADL